MRYLLLTRGMPFCGKSEWIAKHNLQDYTLSLDAFKDALVAPSLSESGAMFKDFSGCDKIGFSMLFSALELRMGRGEFIIIDDNHIAKSYFSNYKETAKIHNYRIFIIDFSDVPLDEIKKRNAEFIDMIESDSKNLLKDSNIESKYKKTYTNDELDALYSELQNNEIPIKCEVIKPSEVIKMLTIEPKSLNGYKVIHHIGDIQGSFSVLKKYIQKIKDNEFYIFLGDYIDRGFQNYEVLKFLISIMDKKNVVLLEGNHEKWLNDWASNKEVESREFRLNTQVELESKGFSRMDAKKIYSKLQPFFFYRFHDKRVICTHGGLSNMPSSPLLISANQCIHGVGGYLNTNVVAASFTKNTPKNFYQFFGHRNKSELPIRIHERNFVMESKVEFGGYLRAVQLTQGGFKDCSLKNSIFVSKEQKDSKHALQKYIDNIAKNSKVKIAYFTHFALISYPNKIAQDILNSPFCFENSVIDIKEWSIVARGFSLGLDSNKKFKESFETYLDSIHFPLKIVSRFFGVRAVIACYQGGFFFFLDSILQDKLPFFLESKETQKELSAIFKSQNVSLHFMLDSKDSFILHDIFMSNSPIPCSEKIEKIAEILNVRHSEILFEFQNKSEFSEFLHSYQNFNVRLAKSVDSNFCELKANGFIESILDSNKFNYFLAFDSSGSFITLYSFIFSEYNVLDQMIKIWKMQGEITLLQWVNNAFRKSFYIYFCNFASENEWKNVPNVWLINAFLKRLDSIEYSLDSIESIECNLT